MIEERISPQYEINWPKWNKLINEKFVPLIQNKSRRLILYGGRGSSKSNFAAKKLIYRCITEPYFKCILIRRSANHIKDSNYNEIKTAIEMLGLSELFKFTENPLQIKCFNGNVFLCRGLDDANKLKSIKDPTCIWWEEEVPDTEDAYLTISTGIRTSRAEYLQEIFTINTDCEGNFEDWWFYKRFFADRPTEKNFTDTKVINLPGGKELEQSYTVHHSTYLDNRFLSEAGKADLLNRKGYRYTVDVLGEWGHKNTGGLFYKYFDRSAHTNNFHTYNPDEAIHLSVDFNVVPYMSATVWQLIGNKAYCIDEIAVSTPNNNTKGLAREFTRRYQSHSSGLFIYGDATGKHQDTRSEKGWNDYKILETELKHFRPSLRVPSRNPAVVQRGNFINTIFLEGFNGLQILISSNCIHLINDFLFLKEDADGKKKKERMNTDGVSFEKYGHHSDTLDYIICEAYKIEYSKYQNGNAPAKRSCGYDQMNTSFKF